jgi:Undecaprenyl-phosphate glucose phosphotransferase
MAMDEAEHKRLGPFTPQGMRGGLARLSKQKLIGFVLVADLIAMVSIGLIALIYYAQASAFFSPIPVLIVLATTVLSVAILRRLWAYTVPSLGAFPRQMRAVLAALAGAAILVLGGMFFLNINVMAYRDWLILWFFGSLTSLGLVRVFVASALSDAMRSGALARRAVIVGGGHTSEELIRRLEKTGETAIHILGLFDDRSDERSPDTVGRYRKIGTFDELVDYCRLHAVDLLIVSLPQSAEERILPLLRKLWELPIDVRIAAHGARLKLSKRAYSYIGDVPFLAVFDRPLSDWDGMVKSVFDFCIAALCLVIFLPLMLLVALLIKLDSRGPVLFRQARYGFNNNLIGVYKFRSMYADKVDPHGARSVTKQDARVTRVGRFIRKTSIDELPQLLNVLKGELSLVGPRPHPTQSKVGDELFQHVVDGYFARHRMKPGITGWAQINGWRGETDTFEKIEQRVEHDLYYIENSSLAFDCYILLMTPFALFNTKNAY